MTAKKVSESVTVMTELVLPNDTNTLNNLMGGRLLHWMDIVAAITAQKHAASIVVTASVDNVSFRKPIKLGNVVTMCARITRAFNTSMEVYIQVRADDVPKQTGFESHTAFYTFVAVDDENKPKPVPEVIPETEEEIKLYETAMVRRQMRLYLAGKGNQENTDELISYLKTNRKPLIE